MMKNPLYKIENLKIARYEHGGGRIYLESSDDNQNRDLICDVNTYGDTEEPESIELRELIFKTVQEYLMRLEQKKNDIH